MGAAPPLEAAEAATGLRPVGAMTLIQGEESVGATAQATAFKYQIYPAMMVSFEIIMLSQFVATPSSGILPFWLKS